MDNHKTSIALLVSNAANGDQFAWSNLYKETFREAYFVARKIASNENDAIDLVHDAFITAFEKLEQLEDKSKFQSWLNTIVANKCRDYLRKSKPLLFSEIKTEDDLGPDWVDDREYIQPEVVLDKNETVRLVAEIIESLPEDQKLCTILYYWNEMSIAQISKALDVSEGTVKSRLNYSRKKIQANVEALKKDGIELYSFAPLPLLIWLLKSEGNAFEAPASAMQAPTIPVAMPTGTSTAKTMSNKAVHSAAIGSTSKSAASALLGKILAGIAALSVAIGGVAFYAVNQERDAVPNSSVDSLDNAHALYEELLSVGNTESGLKIEYYAYVNLDNDNIPELLVSDADGTPNSWSSCEVYTYRDSTLHLCGQTNSRYDYFYLVNNEYVLGKHRMGHQFISTSQFIATTIYHWDDAMTRNDPAISYDNESWEYITKEDFDSYQIMPGEEESASSFIKSAEPIVLKKNTFAQPNLIEEHLSYTDAWGFFSTMHGNDLYFLSMVFNDYGQMDCVLSFATDGQPVKPMGYYKGSYIAFKDCLTIQLASDGNSYTYQFDSDTFSLTQVSEIGLFNTHKVGNTFALIKDEWYDATQIQDLVEKNYVAF